MENQRKNYDYSNISGGFDPFLDGSPENLHKDGYFTNDPDGNWFPAEEIDLFEKYWAWKTEELKNQEELKKIWPSEPKKSKEKPSQLNNGGQNNYKKRKRMREPRQKFPNKAINLQEDLFTSNTVADFISFNEAIFGHEISHRAVRNHISLGFNSLSAIWQLKYLCFYACIKGWKP